MVWDILSWLFFIILIAALIVVGAVLVRGYLNQDGSGASFTGGLFGPKPEKRLEVVDQANVDGRRRLVLIRRDDTEHLLMTGGPVDVVVETNIEPRPKPAIETRPADKMAGSSVEPIEQKSPTLISRTIRPFGRTAGEG